ncbi:MAG: flagellar hook-basal body complex protein [Deltaproteobacteria bacterium]|nr:flagellar hook-basal body complex protein [Deltaproteobacteria bacterium]
MLRSFYAGISGLRNHQQAMDVIGNNISNVNTPGFKSSRVTFMDTLSQTLQGVREASNVLGGRNPVQIGSGMTVAAIDRNMGQGSAQATGRSMDLAIEGKGFFIVGSGANYYYSRAGALSVDNSFNLVTDTGDKVYGWIDSNQDGSIDPTRDSQGWIALDRRGDGKVTNVVASATPTVSGPNQGDAYLGSVTTSPTTVTDDWRIEAVANPAFDPAAAVGGTNQPLMFSVTGARSGVLGTVDVGGTFANTSLGSFVVNGGNLQKAGVSLDVGGGNGIRLDAVDFGAGGNNLSVEFVNRGTNQSIGVQVQGSKIVVSLATNALGQVVNNDGTPVCTLDEIIAAINGHPQASLLVQASLPAGSAGDVAPSVITQRYLQNGAGPDLGDYFTFSTTAPGGATMENISVAKDGTIIGIFDNGTTEELARIAVGNVTNPEGLLSVGGGKFAESPTSGSGFPPLTAGTSGSGTIAAGFLEMSNVDLTREFTDMITTQRGFQANSKIITTSDEMIQDLLTLKR